MRDDKNDSHHGDVNDRGVLYIATGKKYIEASSESARSVKQHCDLPTHLFCDDPDWAGASFDSVETIEHPHRRSKVDLLLQSPFERTLFLDSDTRVVADISGLFELLDRFDLALAHAHKRVKHADLFWRTRIPHSFPQLNTGVLLYRRSPPVDAFLDDWHRAFHEAGFPRDQITFRELLWLSDLRVFVLPPEYNVRFSKYLRTWTADEATPHILHFARFVQPNRLARFLRRFRSSGIR